MRITNQAKRILSLLLVLIFAAAGTPAVFAVSSVDFDQIVNAAAYIIVYNEGSYTTVVRNDNGALSIGQIQWHATNALNLLKDIVAENPTQALNILGAALYNEIITSASWESRIATASEASALSVLLGTEESRRVQDRTAYNYISGYVQHGQSLGITEAQALVFFADYENQNGRSGAASFYRQTLSSYGTVNLATLYRASSQNARRTRTYNFCASVNWSDYTNSTVPGQDTSAPDIENVVVSGLSPDGYTVSCSVSDDTAVTAVYFAVYHEDDGLDGVKWYQQTPGTDGSASHTVAISEFSSRAGNYCTYIYAFDAAGHYAYVELNIITVPQAPQPVPEFSLTVSAVSDGQRGSTILWKAAASGGSGSYEYSFELYRDGELIDRRRASDYSDYSYTAEETGVYTVNVFVTDTLTGKTASAVSKDVYIFEPILVESFQPDRTAAMLGESIFWTVIASGGEGELQYSYAVYRNDELLRSSDYSNANRYVYKPTDGGVYRVTVSIMDSRSQVVSVRSEEVTVIKPLAASNVLFSRSYAVAGMEVSCTADIEGGTGRYSCVFHIYCDGELTLTSEPLSSGEFTFTVPKGGNYTAQITVTDSDSAQVSVSGGELTAEETAIRGDADCDGKVTAVDARLALRCALSLEKLPAIAYAAADVDEDGKVTASDARRILRAAANLEIL